MAGSLPGTGGKENAKRKTQSAKKNAEYFFRVAVNRIHLRFAIGDVRFLSRRPRPPIVLGRRRELEDHVGILAQCVEFGLHVVKSALDLAQQTIRLGGAVHAAVDVGQHARAWGAPRKGGRFGNRGDVDDPGHECAACLGHRRWKAVGGGTVRGAHRRGVFVEAKMR